MLTNCLAACAHLTITVSEIEILVENRHFIIPPCIRRPRVRGVPEYRHPVWYGKTRMVGLPDGEKNGDICNGLDTILACDRQTDRQTDGHLVTAYTRYAYASSSKNCTRPSSYENRTRIVAANDRCNRCGDQLQRR